MAVVGDQEISRALSSYYGPNNGYYKQLYGWIM